MRKTAVFLLMLTLLLGGCSERSSDMFAMPQIPETQEQLIGIVESVLERGYEYSELRSGINRQPLQLMDLDGDGTEEGIAFLRDSVNTYKTFIYIFKRNESGFRLYDIIEGPGNDLLAVSYTDVIGQNGYEIIAEWDSGNPDNKSVRVYNLGETGTELIFDVSAISYAVCDLDGDRAGEFATITRRNNSLYVDIYVPVDGKPRKSKSVPLSSVGGELVRVKTGNITGEKSGIFIERRVELGTAIDVVAHDGKSFVNIFPDGKVCLSDVRCEDVDGDGIIDIPEEPFESYAENVTNRCYKWKNLTEDGKLAVTAFTYHSFAENWYLLLPISWSQTVYAERTIEKSGCVKVHFSTRESLNNDEGGFFEAPLFSVYVLTGENRKRLANEKRGFVISETDDVIFKGEVISHSYLGTNIDEEFVKSIFKKRESEWLSEILFS